MQWTCHLVVILPPEGELMVLLKGRGSNFVSGGVLRPYGVAG